MYKLVNDIINITQTIPFWITIALIQLSLIIYLLRKPPKIVLNVVTRRRYLYERTTQTESANEDNSECETNFSEISEAPSERETVKPRKKRRSHRGNKGNKRRLEWENWKP